MLRRFTVYDCELNGALCRLRCFQHCTMANPPIVSSAA